MKPNLLLKLLSELRFKIAHQLLPSQCVLCGLASEHLLCNYCLALAQTPARCPCCARPMPQAELCGQCLHEPPNFDRTITVFDYAPPLDRLISQYKFQGKVTWAYGLARLLCQQIQTQSILFDGLVSVPLATHRLQERGFNQAHEIARYLAKQIRGTYWPYALSRTRETVKQSWLKRPARQRNIKGVFVLSPSCISRLTGQHIAVVDDVMTSGSTLNEVARLLKQNGAASITNLVIARTPPH